MCVRVRWGLSQLCRSMGGGMIATAGSAVFNFFGESGRSMFIRGYFKHVSSPIRFPICLCSANDFGGGKGSWEEGAENGALPWSLQGQETE